MQRQLHKPVVVLLFLFLFFGGLYYARSFLIPVTFGLVLAMLFLPVCQWLEQHGWHRGWASFASVVILLLCFSLLIFLLSWQVSDLLQNMGQLKENLTGMKKDLMIKMQNALGISVKQQEEMMSMSTQEQGTRLTGVAAKFMEHLSGLLADGVLMLAYVFLFLYFRSRLYYFILKLIPTEKERESEEVIQAAAGVTQKYLVGLAAMIFCLWILYGIGFTLVGLSGALFFAVLCGLLELVPFVGNLTGNIFAALMALMQGGGTEMVLAIVAVYFFVQFFQTYFLEPWVVGTNVDINPLFTIAGLVLGGLIWGVAGMVLAIPLLGMSKILLDHIPGFQPFGYVLGMDRKRNGGVLAKIKKIFK